MNHRESQEEHLFNAACGLADPLERAAFLDRACAGEPVLRQRIEDLLAAQAQAEILFQPLPQLTELPAVPPAPDSTVAEGPGAVIGRYRLLEKVGEGGFGLVYLAEQREPVKRRVALKLIKRGMDTRQVVARFEAERQALALMEHPNIAKVIDGGSTDAGCPYFVMELVRGLPITQHCDEHQLRTAERLALFVQVCQAVQHAHQKGIIHRDLKPSNILITINDGQAVPKVIDFGVAKAIQQELTEKTLFTRFHQFIGTPAYMSPEQADLTSVDIDTRSDIYSLGVLLYELLTGRTPFDGKELLASGLDEMRRTIREKEPARPSTRLRTMTPVDQATVAHLRQAQPSQLIKLLRGDLDWIVMKCLEKDRGRRYETANGLAADLQRYLAHEPVVARPPSAVYRAQKLIRRHRASSLAAALIGLAVVIGGVVSSWALWRERAARRASAERLDAALAFVGQVLTNVVPGLQNLTGAAGVQENLGQATLEFGKRLRVGVEGDPAVGVTLARALIALSSAQNPGGANTVGGYEAGLELAQEAVRLLGAPIASLPESERLDLLLSARFAVIQCLYGQGRWEDGIACAEELELLFDQIEDVSGSSPWLRRQRWNVRANVGYALLPVGRLEQSIDRTHSVLQSDWAQTVGGDSSGGEQEVLANAHGNLAAAQGLLNQFDAMLTNAVAGYRIWTNLVARHPQNARYQAGRIEGWSTLGWAYVSMGRTNEGLALIEQSRFESDALAGRDPANDQFQQIRAVAAGNRALGFAAWSTEAAASAVERRDRLNRAEACLIEAEQFTRLAKSKEAEARLALARAGVEAIRLKLGGRDPGGRPR